MPILNTNISIDILEKISDNNFLEIFKKEYLSTFDKYEMNGNCILCDRVTFFTTQTVGWENTLKKTCKITNNLDIYKYYTNLDLYIMEKFDTILVELLEDNENFNKNYSSNKCKCCFLDE